MNLKLSMLTCTSFLLFACDDPREDAELEDADDEVIAALADDEADDAEFVAAPAASVAPESDLPYAKPAQPAAACSFGDCNFKTPSSQGCLVDAVNYNGWATFSTTFAVYPMVSSSCASQWSRVCALAGWGGYGLTAWDEYAPNAATAKVMTANSGAPPSGFCVDSLMVNAAPTFARACGQNQWGDVACTPYY